MTIYYRETWPGACGQYPYPRYCAWPVSISNNETKFQCCKLLHLRPVVTDLCSGLGHTLGNNTVSWPSSLVPDFLLSLPLPPLLNTRSASFWFQRLFYCMSICDKYSETSELRTPQDCTKSVRNREVPFIQKVYPVMWRPFPVTACHVFESLACTSAPWVQRGLETLKNG